MYYIIWDAEREDARRFGTALQAVKAAMGYKARSWRYFEVRDHLNNRRTQVYNG